MHTRHPIDLQCMRDRQRFGAEQVPSVYDEKNEVRCLTTLTTANINLLKILSRKREPTSHAARAQSEKQGNNSWGLYCGVSGPVHVPLRPREKLHSVKIS